MGRAEAGRQRGLNISEGERRMKFKEIMSRMEGFSTPLGGVSWQPTEPEVSAARRVIAFLEDRRVLYAPDELEVPVHCVKPVLEIRHFLTGELGKLDKSEFAASLRAMRAPVANSWIGLGRMARK
jgi:hypothetical protein